MFSLFDERFLDEGIIEGKTFRFSHDPREDLGPLGKEFMYLKQNNYIYDPITMTMKPIY